VCAKYSCGATTGPLARLTKGDTRRQSRRLHRLRPRPIGHHVPAPRHAPLVHPFGPVSSSAELHVSVHTLQSRLNLPQLGAVNQSINLLLFLQKQNLATAIYLFGLGTLLTGLGLKHMRICSHHDLVGALVTSLFLGRPWWSTTSPTCLPLSVFTITSDQHRCRIPPLL